MKAEASDANSLDLIPEVTDWSSAVRGKFAERANSVRVKQSVDLFDDKERDYTQPSLRAETTYSFYDRSSLTGYEHLRQMLQRWLSRLPPAKQKDIAGRMRHSGFGSPREEQNFNAAFFELFMHEFLIGTGGSPAVDPSFEGRTPDFGVTERDSDGNAIAYVVEATNVNHLSGTNLDSNWNEQRALDILDGIRSPDFFLVVRTEGSLKETPNRKALREPFEKLVGEADYDRVLAAAQLHGYCEINLPCGEFRLGDWRISGHLLPVAPERRPKKGRFVGIDPIKFDWLDPVYKLRTRLEEKAKRYKTIDRLIIALRGDWNLERDEVAEALFGRRVVEVLLPKDLQGLPGASGSREVQRPDGFWFNSQGPRHQNVIGVLMFTSLYPHNVDRANAAFFGNPFFDGSLPAWAKEVTRAEYRDGEVHFVNGVSPGTFAIDHEPWREEWELERQESG